MEDNSDIRTAMVRALIEPWGGDMNQLAKRIADLSVGEATKEPLIEREKNPHAVALARLGGQRGGKVRDKRPDLLTFKLSAHDFDAAQAGAPMTVKEMKSREDLNSSFALHSGAGVKKR